MGQQFTTVQYALLESVDYYPWCVKALMGLYSVVDPKCPPVPPDVTLR
jgi:hypothetical protein